MESYQICRVMVMIAMLVYRFASNRERLVNTLCEGW